MSGVERVERVVSLSARGVGVDECYAVRQGCMWGEKGATTATPTLPACQSVGAHFVLRAPDRSIWTHVVRFRGTFMAYIRGQARE